MKNRYLSFVFCIILVFFFVQESYAKLNSYKFSNCEKTSLDSIKTIGSLVTDNDSVISTKTTVPVFYSIGNMIFNDLDNNGKWDPISDGKISGVIVVLYKKNNMTYDSIGTDTTGSDGLYIFEGSGAGTFKVVIHPSNFNVGKPLYNFISSTGSYQTSNPNNDIDGDDNGLQFPDSILIVSNDLIIEPNEPLGEIPYNATSPWDDQTNLTLDFGFMACSLITYYRDADGDGFGNLTVTKDSCTQPMGYVINDDDCDDAHFDINPSGIEICNGLDDNCNSIIDDGIGIIFYRDADGDGFGNLAVTKDSCAQPMGYVINNTDCNDGNPLIKPGVIEICNATDDNCNSLVDDGIGLTFYRDADGDGFGNLTVTKDTCAQPIGYVLNSTDCNDANPLIMPNGTEICNVLDDNCNSLVDDGINSTFYNDADVDGFGNLTVTKDSCAQPMGYVINNTDCNDGNPLIKPGVIEICNATDDNCNSLVDDGISSTFYRDADGDGFGDLTVTKDSCAQPMGYVIDHTDCNDSDALVHMLTLWYLDVGGDGFGGDSSKYFCNNPNTGGGIIGTRNGSRQQINNWVTNTDDFNDNDATSYPNAPEICDGVDNNNNGSIDEGLQVITYYQDADVDGFGNINMVKDSCIQPIGYVINNTDCNDNAHLVNPGMVEIQLNGVDDDCNGQIDCPPITIEYNSVHCSFAILPWSTTPITASGDYSHLYASNCGGDSTVIFHITIHPVHSIIVNVDACQSYTLPWNETISTSGVYTQSYTNQYGCDSTLIYNVYFPPVVRDTTLANGCDSVLLYLPNGLKKFYTNQVYPDTLTFLGECSSIQFWKIEVYSSYSSRDTIINCEPIVHPQLGLLTDTIQLTYIHPSIFGCDSVVIYQVYIAEQNITEIGPLFACDSLIIPDLDTIYDSGLHSYVFIGSNGCDSTVFYNVGIYQSTNSYLNIEVCNQYILNSKIYTATGNYIDTTLNGEGCTHFIYLNLTILPAPPKPVVVATHPNCYEQGFLNITNPADYVSVSQNVNGSYVPINIVNNLPPDTFAIRTQLASNFCYSDTTFVELILVPNIKFYLDADGDGHGNPIVFKDTCIQPDGYVYDNLDIDDQNPNINVLFSIGNMVYKDMNENGYYDLGDSLVSGVEVSLFKYDLSNNLVFLDSVYTDNNGLYLFDTLNEGQYVVVIDSINFEPSKPLYQTTISQQSTYCFFDYYDGGNIGSASGSIPNEISSCDIELNLNPFSTPTNEMPNNDNSGAMDYYSNLAIDFGFAPPPPIGSCGSPNSYLELTSQSQVDAFPSLNPGCSYYRGYLQINGTDISNLDSLIYLHKIGHLTIGLGYNSSSFGNPILTNLRGLNDLVKVDRNFQIGFNEVLSNISALSSLDTVGQIFEFRGNPLLADFSPIEHINTIGYAMWFGQNNSLLHFPNFDNLSDDAINLSIYRNNNLKDVSGFNNFTEIGSIDIQENNALKKISGFKNLINIQNTFNSYLTIRNNSSLDSITGFKKLRYVKNNFQIYNNPSLSTCCGLFNMVNVGDFGGNIYMPNNEMGCEDTLQIRQYGSCETIEVSINSNNWSNPFTWDGNIIPNATNIVIIPSGYTIYVDTPAAIAKKVEVMPGGNLIINPGMMLTITSQQNGAAQRKLLKTRSSRTITARSK